MNDSCVDCLCKDDDLQCSTCEINKSSGLSLRLEELREYDIHPDEE